MAELVLASKSPRRIELIKNITENFEVLPSDCEETYPEGTDIFDIPQLLAAQKALNVAEKRPDALIVGCDTVVVIHDKILGKPKDEAEAVKMLMTLSGKTHIVVSGVFIRYRGKSLSFTQKTRVTFYEFTEEDAKRYVKECNPLDKAGSYAVQDKGMLFVKEIEGDYYNIVGLPVARLNLEIQKLLKLAGDENGLV
ncbi:MAG: septum formation protein Maf [Oscillospiraceae bacterium]|nr:septum formation protein Maf [Oscillospiraceae bacterium]